MNTEDAEAIVSITKQFELVLVKPTDEPEEIRKQLGKYLNDLVATDFNKLIAILYRVDISQENAVAALADLQDKESAGETLAALIIAREKQKIYFRKLYSK